MRNVQSRVIEAPAEVVGALLNDFGSDADVLWPKPQWGEAKLDRGLEPGSTGGHGPIRYTVTEFEPGKRVRLQFDPTIGIVGYHELRVAPRGAGRSEMTHIVDGRVTGRMRLLWPVVVRWGHEAVLHDLLDNAELAATGKLAAGKSRWSPWVRFLRKVSPE